MDMDCGNYNENGGNGSVMVAKIVAKVMVVALVVARGNTNDGDVFISIISDGGLGEGGD